MRLRSTDTHRSAPALIDDLASNYGYAAVAALITIFVVPIYVRLLGVQTWGSVSLCLALQGVLLLMDMALSPVLLREAARAHATDGAQMLYLRFLRFYAVCAAVAITAVAIILLLLSSVHPLSADLVAALPLALLQFLFQFCNNAATGYWYGQRQQRRANLRLAGFMLCKHAGALLALNYWRTSAVAYLLPFAAISIVEFIANHIAIRSERPAQKFAVSAPALAWRDLTSYAAATVLALATSQIDRIWLAFALPADRYGIYYLGSSLMASFLSLQLPLQRAFLPRLAVATAAVPAVARTMLKFETLIVLPSLLCAAFPEFVLRLWLHDAAIAGTAALPFRLLMLAAACNAVYAPSGLLLLVAHRYKTMVAINATILAIQGVLLVTMTPRLGAIAGACAWLVCGFVQVICAAYLWRTDTHVS